MTAGDRKSQSGKSRGRHYERRLTAAFVRSAPPGRHTDGGGLYLVVDPSGARRWMQRIVVRGRRRDFGLGSAQFVSLADAREIADRNRSVARTGGDPREDAEVAAKVFVTFDELAAKVHAVRISTTSRNGKHVDQWLATIQRYASPHIGSKPVHLVSRSDVMRVLEPIWLDKQETARRVLQRMRVIFNYALSHEYRVDGNPTSGVEDGLGVQKRKVRHFAHAHWVTAGTIFKALGQKPGLGAMALRFTIATAARSGAVRKATWAEIDEARMVWCVPAEHMKAGEEFAVPLSDQAREVLRQAEVYRSGPDSLIFPSPTATGSPISENTMLKILKEGWPGLTVHGFRSSFRLYADDMTSFSRDVKEAALAHALPKLLAAYSHTDYFDERMDLMDAWGAALAEVYSVDS